MEYALFEVLQDKSTPKALQDYRAVAQNILSKYGKLEHPYPYRVLCCPARDTNLFGDLLHEENYAKVAHQVLYFSHDPEVFERVYE